VLLDLLIKECFRAGKNGRAAPEDRRQGSLIRRMLFVMATNPKAAII
jgi:hypothetical protein